MTARHAASLMLFAAPLLLAGCERAMHDMYVQPRYGAGSPSTLFSDGNSGRTPPTGALTFSRSEVNSSPPPLSRAVLERGRNRFNIYCAPCHGEGGDGAGMVVERGFPAPPSYHTAKLRDAADSHLYDVISNGYGVMYPYADRIDPNDRWAIVGYIRALQLSQNAPCGRLNEADLQRLNSSDSPRQQSSDRQSLDSSGSRRPESSDPQRLEGSAVQAHETGHQTDSRPRPCGARP